MAETQGSCWVSLLQLNILQSFTSSILFCTCVSRRLHQWLVVNKKGMIKHTLAIKCFMCAEKKEEGIGAWGKQFYVLAPCRVACIIFLLAGQKTWVVAANTMCDDHAGFLTLSENYRKLSLVARLWLRPSLNLSHCKTLDHRLGATITEIATIVSWCQSFIWDSRKSCSVFRA